MNVVVLFSSVTTVEVEMVILSSVVHSKILQHAFLWCCQVQTGRSHCLKSKWVLPLASTQLNDGLLQPKMHQGLNKTSAKLIHSLQVQVHASGIMLKGSCILNEIGLYCQDVDFTEALLSIRLKKLTYSAVLHTFSGFLVS